MACSGGEECRTCDGRCCSLFTFSVDLKVIADRYADPAHPGTTTGDDLKLLELLKPITVEEAKERAEQFGVEGSYKRALDSNKVQPNGYYTCRAWDEDTGLCTVYDDRPLMCRGYPYGDGQVCSHGCSYTITDEEMVEHGYISPRQWFLRPYS